MFFSQMSVKVLNKVLFSFILAAAAENFVSAAIHTNVESASELRDVIFTSSKPKDSFSLEPVKYFKGVLGDKGAIGISEGGETSSGPFTNVEGGLSKSSDKLNSFRNSKKKSNNLAPTGDWGKDNSAFPTRSGKCKTTSSSSAKRTTLNLNAEAWQTKNFRIPQTPKEGILNIDSTEIPGSYNLGSMQHDLVNVFGAVPPTLASPYISGVGDIHWLHSGYISAPVPVYSPYFIPRLQSYVPLDNHNLNFEPRKNLDHRQGKKTYSNGKVKKKSQYVKTKTKEAEKPQSSQESLEPLESRRTLSRDSEFVQKIGESRKDFKGLLEAVSFSPIRLIKEGSGFSDLREEKNGNLPKKSTSLPNLQLELLGHEIDSDCTLKTGEEVSVVEKGRKKLSKYGPNNDGFDEVQRNEEELQKNYQKHQTVTEIVSPIDPSIGAGSQMENPTSGLESDSSNEKHVDKIISIKKLPAFTNSPKHSDAKLSTEAHGDSKAKNWKVLFGKEVESPKSDSNGDSQTNDWEDSFNGKIKSSKISDKTQNSNERDFVREKETSKKFNHENLASSNFEQERFSGRNPLAESLGNGNDLMMMKVEHNRLKGPLTATVYHGDQNYLNSVKSFLKGYSGDSSLESKDSTENLQEKEVLRPEFFDKEMMVSDSVGKDLKSPPKQKAGKGNKAEVSREILPKNQAKQRSTTVKKIGPHGRDTDLSEKLIIEEGSPQKTSKFEYDETLLSGLINKINNSNKLKDINNSFEEISSFQDWINGVVSQNPKKVDEAISYLSNELIFKTGKKSRKSLNFWISNRYEIDLMIIMSYCLTFFYAKTPSLHFLSDGARYVLKGMREKNPEAYRVAQCWFRRHFGKNAKSASDKIAQLDNSLS